MPADHATIQGAIDAAAHGDVIIVAPGTYVLLASIDMDGKAITLRSSDPNDQAVVDSTIIDGNQAHQVFRCQSGEGPDTVINGLTIRNGLGTIGGGMLNTNSNPTVLNCTFTGNQGGQGGAIYNSNSSPLVMNCNFINNNSDARGGGMHNSSNSNPMVLNCTFVGNIAGIGGGMYNRINSNPIVTDCLFIGNSASDNGGGMHNLSGSSPIVTDCVFANNTAKENGGGMYNFTGCNPVLTNCVFRNNSAGARGGGLYNRTNCFPTLLGCTIAENSAGTEGGAILNTSGSFVTLSNGILWNNMPDEVHDQSGTPSDITFSIIQGGSGLFGIGTIDADPLFVDPTTGDFRLSPGSPAIDSGDSSAFPVGVTTDLDGNPRYQDDTGVIDTGIGPAPVVDMGCYEFQGTSPCLGDCDESGTVDFNDLVSLLFEFGNPAPTAECDTDGNGDIDFNDLVAALFLFGSCP